MDYEEMADWFKALAHPGRLQILNMLRHGEICVCHIERSLGKRQPYISQQLMLLREAGMVESRRDGLQVYYSLADPRLDPLLSLMCGPADPAGHEVIDGCTCPHCQTVSLIEIK